MQVKGGIEKACITDIECEKLIKQAEWYKATPYILYRIGDLRRGEWFLETANKALRDFY